MVAPLRFRYSQVEPKRREGLVCLVSMCRWAMASFFLPAWMIDYSV